MAPPTSVTCLRLHDKISAVYGLPEDDHPSPIDALPQRCRWCNAPVTYADEVSFCVLRIERCRCPRRCPDSVDLIVIPRQRPDA